MEEIIKITVIRCEKVEVKEFDNDKAGQRLSTAFCKELQKEHMKQPFFQLMELANGKSDLQDFLRRHTKIEPPTLSVKIETVNKEDDDLL